MSQNSKKFFTNIDLRGNELRNAVIGQLVGELTFERSISVDGQGGLIVDGYDYSRYQSDGSHLDFTALQARADLKFDRTGDTFTGSVRKPAIDGEFWVDEYELITKGFVDATVQASVSGTQMLSAGEHINLADRAISVNKTSLLNQTSASVMLVTDVYGVVTHTFSGLTAGQRYTVNAYAADGFLIEMSVQRVGDEVTVSAEGLDSNEEIDVRIFC